MSSKREHIECAALVAEIVGAFAVIVSVVYLAVQIADNTRALQSEGHYNALQLAQRPLELLISDVELAEIVAAGYAAPDTLSAANRERFDMYQVMAFNAWEYLFYAHQAESIPDKLWTGADAYYSGLVAAEPALAGFWVDYRHIYAEPFRGYVAGQFAAAAESRLETVGASP
jgi:hypothetical protein